MWEWSLYKSKVIIIPIFKITDKNEGIKKLLLAFKTELNSEPVETKIKKGNVILRRWVLLANKFLSSIKPGFLKISGKSEL